jgi:hypothetical protein
MLHWYDMHNKNWLSPGAHHPSQVALTQFRRAPQWQEAGTYPAREARRHPNTTHAEKSTLTATATPSLHDGVFFLRLPLHGHGDAVVGLGTLASLGLNEGPGVVAAATNVPEKGGGAEDNRQEDGCVVHLGWSGDAERERGHRTHGFSFDGSSGGEDEDDADEQRPEAGPGINK